jgi:Type II secretion system (T2SS), protein E, N-terminal domain
MRFSFESLLPSAHRGWKDMYAECGLPACRNTLFMRSVQSRVGISVGEKWYCSVDCFAVAAGTRIASLTGANVLEMPHSPRLSIGLVMLSKGYLTDAQLRLATSQSQLRGEELESVLLRLGLASERQLTVARAAQWGYPVLGQDYIGKPVESDIPSILLQSCSAVPLHCSTAAKRLLLGFVRRVDHSLLNSVEQVTGFRGEPCFIAPADFAEQMERLTAAPKLEQVVFEDTKTPAQMGKTIGGMAVDVGLREARFAHCRDYVWTRLLGKRQTIDVLFRIKGSRNAGSSFISEGVRSAG